MASLSTSLPGRNEPCWCGSSLKYKHCHSDIDTARGASRIVAAKRVYLRGWEQNSRNLEQQGVYEWMAERLEPYKPKRVLDVGTGDGQGVAALWRRFQCKLLISLDENRECLIASEQRLKKNGVPSSVIQRLDVEMESDESYFLSIIAGRLPQGDGVFLIESDILADPELENFLSSIPPFDAITIWLIGTHLMRNNCLNLTSLKIKDTVEYRLRVQNKVYEMADRILRPGGVLQVVDRGEEPNDEILRKDTIDAHKSQAAPTSLQFKSLEYMRYSEIEKGKRVNMVLSPGESGRIPKAPQFAILSVISTKQI